MANGIAKLVIGVALVSAIGGSLALTPINKPREDVAFLERVAAKVERAKVIAPDTREYLSELASRHQSQLYDARLDLRRQKALDRILVAIDHTEPVAGPFSVGRAAK